MSIVNVKAVVETARISCLKLGFVKLERDLLQISVSMQEHCTEITITLINPRNLTFVTEFCLVGKMQCTVELHWLEHLWLF